MTLLVDSTAHINIKIIKKTIYIGIGDKSQTLFLYYQKHYLYRFISIFATVIFISLSN